MQMEEIALFSTSFDSYLKQHLEWFKNYVAQWYQNADEVVKKNIRLKEEHSYRVLINISKLAELVGFEVKVKRLAEMVGLYHDIARFKQFYTFKTFDDRKSFNHAEKSVEIIQEEGVLKNFSYEDRERIIWAIRLHNKKILPKISDPIAETLAKLIRDADKLDIWYIVGKELSNKDDPSISLDYAGNDRYNKEIIRLILQRQMVDYNLVRSTLDFKLTTLAWIFDINFPETFLLIKEREILDPILNSIHLPEINVIKNLVQEIVASQCSKTHK